MLIVEDGTGIDDANSYVDIPFADEYFANRNNVAWSELSDENKTAALIIATQYVEFRFGARFIGYTLGCCQEVTRLSWPRKCTCYPEDAIPKILKEAICEYAAALLTFDEETGEWTINQSLSPAQTRDDLVTMEKVGPVEVRYADTTKMEDKTGTKSVYTSYPVPDGMIARLLKKFRLVCYR